MMILLLLSTAWATPVYRAYPDYGVEVVGLGLAAAGYMIDFRYRVVDPVKAAPMFDRRVKPWCEVAKSGARLMVPAPAKTGPLRQVGRKVKPGSQLFIMFANPGRHVQRGDKVTIVVGDYRFADLVVQ
ncbi:MAG: hypothetical protein D6790_11870 [Caldilineae bacterium]|nr:MAG: hypothetical protein D6790_11870 [Caldilineae bacterium]